MASITFDTLKYVETLIRAGVPEAQAKAFLEAEQLAHGSSNVAAQSDIADLKQDIRELELRIGARFERLEGEQKLIRWALLLILGGVISLVMKAFLHV